VVLDEGPVTSGFRWRTSYKWF